MKIVATIEARMNSTRLPGKVLMDIGGIRSLECQIKRLRRSNYINEIVLATTTNKTDDELVSFANEMEISVYRGSEDDVLARILGAAQSVDGDLQVQITGDCPLIDSVIVDQVIKTYLDFDGEIDFVSNEIIRSFPIGLDCRVFPVNILAAVDKVCSDPIHRVHGSTYIYIGDGVKIYKSHNIAAPSYLDHPDWRWTLDTPEDLIFVRRVSNYFGERITDVPATEILAFLNGHPEILAINSHVIQKLTNEG
jgi:spore coat polysaccharide biosynthesis protein SpsF